jgi:hypothetical protein
VRATAGAKTPYDVALALEKRLRTSHPYDGSATLPRYDPDGLAHWITSGSAGYCQMFSASMTELLRLLGVRARIAEGFVTGRYDPASKSYVVDDRDAHAWVEAWLPGTGFVPFDPTPGRSLPTQASSSAGVDPATSGSSTKTPRTPATKAPTADPGGSAPATGARASSAGSGGWLRGALGLAAALVLLVVAAWAARVRIAAGRARGARSEVGAARGRLVARARRRGLELPPGVTNGELAEALGVRFELDAARWASAADVAAYGPADEAERVLPELRDETRRLRKAIGSRRRVTLPV